ncbi:MAG: NAD(P)/FAD-dependent oxidoreductase [Pseudomonadota bacterium]
MSNSIAQNLSPAKAEREVDVVIVGAGFAGLYALHEARGKGLSAVVFEAGSEVGGTWNWNRYPGARCDIESLQYSYSFDAQLEQEWQWTERYATQPEILAYLNHVADRFDLRRDISMNTRVQSIAFDEATNRWTVVTDQDDRVTSRFCIMATGNLSAARVPDITGRESFGGPTYHTGHWPHEGVDFTGKRVAVIGTGSSGIQAIPKIAEQAAQLTVFQRTPAFSLPARNMPLDPDKDRAWKSEYPFHRNRARTSRSGLLTPPGTGKKIAEATADEHRDAFEFFWEEGGPGLLGSFADIMLDQEANKVAADFVRGKIREMVKDPVVAERLSPSDYPIGAKRICIDTGYFDTYNRPNVALVDLRETPIERITPTGIATSDAEYAFDAIVFATGFDAMTGALSRIEISGRDGLKLTGKWSAGPRTYLGLMTAGFPNLFLITGPGSPSVVGNVVLSIEFAVDFVIEAIDAMESSGRKLIDVDIETEDEWVDHVRDVANMTLYSVANSWYLGANVPGKPRVFMPYVGGNIPYRQKVAAVIENDYEGFVFDAETAQRAQAVNS